jgi:hypothetical protein
MKVFKCMAFLTSCIAAWKGKSFVEAPRPYDDDKLTFLYRGRDEL